MLNFLKDKDLLGETPSSRKFYHSLMLFLNSFLALCMMKSCGDFFCILFQYILVQMETKTMVTCVKP
jgi:hypothetical protein